MADNKTTLKSYEWKHKLSPIPLESVNSLVCLYDLIYDSEQNPWISSDSPATAGTNLNHNIICYNSNLVKSSGELAINSGALSGSSAWWVNGIDISLVQYDPRAKSKKVLCDAQTPDGKSVFVNGSYTIFDKNAAIAPADIEQFCSNGILRHTGTLSVPASTSNYIPPKMINVETNNIDTNKFDIYLSSTDTVFKGTLVSRSSYYAYNTIFVNPTTTFGKFLIARAIGIDPKLICNTILEDNAGAYNSFTANTNYNFIATTAGNSQDSLVDIIGKEKYFDILKNTFVWVRASFYGDYINPEPFDQDLNPTARVVHDELMLSGSADFNSYDRYIPSAQYVANTQEQDALTTTISRNELENEEYGVEGRSEETEPYIPVTSPTVDFFTDAFLRKYLPGLKETSDTNYSSRLKNNWSGEQIEQFLYDYVSGNDPVVKGIPLAPINRSSISNPNAENLLPPGWFDPESRNSDDYYKAMGKFPTIVPKHGNAYIGGRIISVTIDELWYIIKKLIGGRDKDEVLTNESFDIGVPVGKDESAYNTTDTRMTEVPDSEYNFTSMDGTTKKGDPVGISYDKTDPNNTKLTITKFINQNDSIKYPVFSSLQALSKTITNANNLETTRGIKNFTAWANNSVDSTNSDAVIADNAIVSDGVWSPRGIPYSLRELEAMIMDEKFNTITQARFVKETFGVTGRFGKVAGEKDNMAAGSLFQFHKDYNYDIEKPNTWYNKAGTGTAETGTQVQLDDPTDPVPSLVNINPSVKKYVKNYGVSDKLGGELDDYSSSDVYLAADGTWRYLFDQVKIPILKSRF